MVIQIADQDLIEQIQTIANAQQKTPEEVVADAVHQYLDQTSKVSGVSFLLSIAGQGASGQHDVSERDEAILATEIDPVQGWTSVQSNEDTT